MPILFGLAKPILLACARRQTKPNPAHHHKVTESTERPGSLQGSKPFKKPELPFTALARSDVIDVFGPALCEECAGTPQARSLRPASRDLSDGARSGNTNPQGRTGRTEVHPAWRPSVRHAGLRSHPDKIFSLRCIRTGMRPQARMS